MNIGEYQVTVEVKKDTVYQWFEAVDQNQENRVLLQIVQPDISSDAIAAIMSYFDMLQGIRRKGILVPVQMFSDPPEYPLVLVYSHLSREPLAQVLKHSPGEALEWWHQASETLHALHNKHLVHGHISIDSFVVADGRLYLTGFGYTPLLQLGHQGALQECGEVLAPEVLDHRLVTPAADIYAFGKTVASTYPQLATTQWYSQVTDVNPDNRFKRMRNLFDVLKEAFTTLFSSESPEEEPTNKQEPPQTNGVLVPKYILSVKVEPPEAGKVTGDGSYPADENARVTATPSAGWNFARWSGDISGSSNQATLKMNGDKTIVAQFAKVPEYILSVRVEPPEAGKVTGGGSYLASENVTVTASPSAGWNFDRWSGDISDSSNQATLKMNGNKTIVAHFVKVPEYVLSVRVEPPEAGKVTGGGSYLASENARVTATPSAGWKFDHWSDNLRGVGNQVTVKMDANKTVVAHFAAKVQTPVRLKLWVSAEPAEAGNVSGGGNYEAGAKVRVRAWKASQLWRFDHWSGDLRGSENPAELVMDANKMIKAHFVEVPQKSGEGIVPGPPNASGTEQNVGQQTRTSDSQEREQPGDAPPPQRSPGVPKWAQPSSD